MAEVQIGKGSARMSNESRGELLDWGFVCRQIPKNKVRIKMELGIVEN